jgi:hypothetical protein
MGTNDRSRIAADASRADRRDQDRHLIVLIAPPLLDGGDNLPSFQIVSIFDPTGNPEQQAARRQVS